MATVSSTLNVFSYDAVLAEDGTQFPDRRADALPVMLQSEHTEQQSYGVAANYFSIS